MTRQDISRLSLIPKIILLTASEVLLYGFLLGLGGVKKGEWGDEDEEEVEDSGQGQRRSAGP